MDESNITLLKAIKEDIMSESFCKVNPESSKNTTELPIAESVAQNKKTISKDKLHSCEKNSPSIESSKISVADSTISVRGCNPYWEESLQGISSKLWLPTEIALQDSDLNSLNILHKKTVAESWFSAKGVHIARKENLSRTFIQSCMSSLAESMGFGDTGMKSKKIRIFPTTEQKTILKCWFGVARKTYNATVEYLKKPETKASWMKIAPARLEALPDYCKDTPYKIKDIAIRDSCQAVSAAKKKYKQTGKFQEVKFRNKHHPVQSCFIPSKAVTKKGVYHTKLGILKFAQALPDEIRDSRLVRHNGRYFLCIPYKMKRVLSENQGRLVSLDPGIRSFLTFFSEDSCGKIGDGDFKRIFRLCLQLDKVESISAKAKAKERYKLRQAKYSLRNRIKDLIDELHHKAARFLCENFDVILLPTFETSRMSKRGERKLRTKTVRSLLSYAHYRFKNFLYHKAFELGKCVIDVCESYTSKTCSWNGKIIENLGGRKKIRDEEITMDRDYNGARGIFLRALVDSPLLLKNGSTEFVKYC